LAAKSGSRICSRTCPAARPARCCSSWRFVFVLGFFLDFVEISVIVLPLIAPTLILMGHDPIWLGVLLAINLQTSFLTPPFGFSLFYLRGAAPKEITTGQIYAGVIPFIGLQILGMALVWFLPHISTWLPGVLF
jgi:TRAP-type mannitol/chloroaromatic compound transport system permease large subunit